MKGLPMQATCSVIGPMSEVTQMLQAVEQGDPNAADELLPLVYGELRKLARSRMAREQPGHTLQATALVHEAWLRLVSDDDRQWANRRHFFAAAAEAMRRILVESARRKSRKKRGAGVEHLDVNEMEIAIGAGDDRILQIHEALESLAAQDPEKAEIVKLKYFVGLTNEEAAELLNLSEKTVRRRWAFAKAWLLSEMKNPSA